MLVLGAVTMVSACRNVAESVNFLGTIGTYVIVTKCCEKFPVRASRSIKEADRGIDSVQGVIEPSR